MTDLGTLGGSSSSGGAINHFGQVTGGAYTSGGAVHAFLYRNGAMTDLGTLGGSYSTGSAINHFGQVTGSASIANGADHAFLYNNGGMTDLGTLGGSSSNGQAINNAGQVTGYATTAGGAEHAFLFSNGQMHDVNSFNGVAGMGWTLRNAAGINDVGQIVGSGFVPAGTRAYVLTLNTTVWGGAPNASWDDAANWSYGIGPNKNTHVYIEPVGSRTVLGPTGAVDLKRLTIGGNPADGSAIATLKLNGGQINLLSDTNVSLALTAGLELTANGVLTGQGTIRNGNVNGFNFSSYGRIVADDVSLKRMDVSNHGTIEGDGRLAASLIYNDGGHIRIAHAGDRLKLDAEVINYVGAIDVIRGEVEITGELKNESQVNLRDGILRTDTFKNFGRFEISSGASDVFGSVSNEDIGRIIVSGQGQVTFWNTVESYGELRVSNGAVATFFGDFYARTNKLTGTGSKYYEAGYFIGNSPGVASDEGNVAFGSEAFVEVEIGGLAAGNGDGFHDKLIVLGDLGLDGTLKLVSWKGFTGQAGESFDLFDWGTLSGTFDNIDSSGLLLAAGATLDTRRLYIDGTISVTAVPEPETWAMLLVGLGLVGWTVRRRRNA
jgi:probable HAF family extracellular repeat protein